jgi:hypothetical protein
MSTALDRYRAKHPGKSDEELLAAATTELDRIQEGQASLASALSGTVETLLQRNIAPKEDRASAHRSALGAVLDALQRRWPRDRSSQTPIGRRRPARC